MWHSKSRWKSTRKIRVLAFCSFIVMRFFFGPHEYNCGVSLWSLIIALFYELHLHCSSLLLLLVTNCMYVILMRARFLECFFVFCSCFFPIETVDWTYEMSVNIVYIHFSSITTSSSVAAWEMFYVLFSLIVSSMMDASNQHIAII